MRTFIDLIHGFQDRPVSNLSFVSKISDKIALKQLEEYLVNNELIDVLQYAYRVKHSKETVLLKVQSDILSFLDEEVLVDVLILTLTYLLHLMRLIIHFFRHVDVICITYIHDQALA